MTGFPKPDTWRVVRRVAFAAFLVAVSMLLYRHAREVEWAKVGEALTGYTPALLATAVGLALASHLLYSSFDLLARRLLGHDLPRVTTLAIAAVSYAFNLNLGGLIGGIGFRYRLYSRFGLAGGMVARIYALCVTTNWSGFLLLLGVLLTFDLVTVPEQWRPDALASRALGVAMLVALAAYLGLCTFLHDRDLTLRGRRIPVPHLRHALVQLGASCANWMIMAGVMYVLLQGQVAWPHVLGTLLMAAIAGVVAHIPAGLGVLETVFVLMLSGQVAQPDVIAALLVYRAVYYLGPLLLALGGFAALEVTANRDRSPALGEQARS